MDFHLNRADEKLKKEAKLRERKRRQEAASKRAVAQMAAKQREEMEARLQAAKEEKQRQLEQEEQRRMEEDILTGGIEYGAVLRATALPDDVAGDKVVLPVGALETLTAKGVFDQGGAMFFELRTREGGYTHCGVREFVAEEDTIGLPAKVAACLAAVTDPDDAQAGVYATRVNVKYVRLDKGTKVVLQPHTAEFQKDADEGVMDGGAAAKVGGDLTEDTADDSLVQTLTSMGFPENGSRRAALAVQEQQRQRSGSAAFSANEMVPRCVQWLMAPSRTTSELQEDLAEGLQAVLERTLHSHTALTVGDVVTVRHREKVYELTVQQLEPAERVSLVNTELEVEIAPSREYEQAMLAKAAAEAEAEAAAAAREAVEAAEAEAARAAARAAAAEAAAAEAAHAQRASEATALLAEHSEPVSSGAAGEGGNSVLSCAVRLPSGARVQRRFRGSDPVGLLFVLVDAAGCDADLARAPYQLASAHPRRVLTDPRPPRQQLHSVATCTSRGDDEGGATPMLEDGDGAAAASMSMAQLGPSFADAGLAEERQLAWFLEQA